MLKLGFRFSIGIQYRVFFIPWVKKHSAPRILCSEQRDFNSSGMVKYVPKKSRKIGEDFTSKPVDGSEKGIYVDRMDHQCKDNNKEARVGRFLQLQERNDAGMYSDVSCDDSGEELEENSNDVRYRGNQSKRQHKKAYDEVKLHMEAEQAKSSKEACKTTQDAENMAIRCLGLRAYSAAELKKKLIGKKYPLDIVDKVINDFQNRGYINDGLYAESYSRSRWSSLSWGPRRIKQALLKKGISNKDSEAAIKLVFEKGQHKEGAEEAESEQGMSKETVDQLYAQASKRWLQGRDLPSLLLLCTFGDSRGFFLPFSVSLRTDIIVGWESLNPMGKRKERRFAAMNSTGRRVKLDLFAEPSEDLGGSDVRDGVEREQTEPNELPNSPSSSGQRTENPLLLLGQYSDDEVEEDSAKKADDTIADCSLANKNEQVDGLVHEEHKHTNIKSGAETPMQMVEQQQAGEDSSASDFKTISDGLNKQTDPHVQASCTVSLEHPAPTHVTSQWKMILHEESNQYYYWNTETGETSWGIPAVFTQTAGAYGAGYNESGAMVTDESTLTSGEPSYVQPVQNIFTGTGTDCSTSLTVELRERNPSENVYVKSLGTDGRQAECSIGSAVNYQPCQELSGPGNSDLVHANVETGAATDLPSRLLSQSESLLEKLRSLKKSHGNFHSNEQISKYILEVEVRHSDVKALMLDTSPLHSFWLHTEKQLKRLEDSVNDEIYELAKSAVMDEVAETSKTSPKEKLVTDANTESDTEDSGRGELAQSGKPLNLDESADVGEDGSHTGYLVQQLDDVTPSGKMLRPSPVVEDIDMDVDMEVEELVPVSSVQVIDDSDSKMFSQTEPSNLHTDVPPPPGEELIPPPPGEELIPPPPSEREEVPPPPPDSYSEVVPPPPLENGHDPPPLPSDSLGVTYTLPHSYMQQSADYAAQYNLSYPESSYQYIANAVALTPDTQFYGHIDGSQVSLPQSTYYYENAPGTSEVAPAEATAVEAYYNGAAPLFPVISSAESSLHPSGLGLANYNIPSNTSTAVEPSSRSNDSAEMASSGTVSQSTDVKGHSKVKRPKKRTVTATSTLRSNKKVSSLVDKWKAAKEELNDSEEEEGDDYGILDKKRQREIEEWKSRQIASGEAKDNANFQPLGGDWREKVKRRKERAGREAKKSLKKEDKQQKPDLTKLSANLPSGWQAYWDDSTKKVYYGNTSTSQTSWTRPTTT